MRSAGGSNCIEENKLLREMISEQNDKIARMKQRIEDLTNEIAKLKETKEQEIRQTMHEKRMEFLRDKETEIMETRVYKTIAAELDQKYDRLEERCRNIIVSMEQRIRQLLNEASSPEGGPHDL